MSAIEGFWEAVGVEIRPFPFQKPQFMRWHGFGMAAGTRYGGWPDPPVETLETFLTSTRTCLLYTSDAADE